jgi:hypothetical protein
MELPEEDKRRENTWRNCKTKINKKKPLISQPKKINKYQIKFKKKSISYLHWVTTNPKINFHL